MSEIFPVLHIEAASDYETLHQAIDRLPSIDFAIFVSRNAAIYGLEAIFKRYDSPPPKIHWLAIGPETARTLEESIKAPVLRPPCPPYES